MVVSRALLSPPLMLFRAGSIQDFANSSLGVENKGFQMLRGLGWEEGAGLGAKGARRLELHLCRTLQDTRDAGLSTTRVVCFCVGQQEREWWLQSG